MEKTIKPVHIDENGSVSDDTPEEKIGEYFKDPITGKSSLIIHGQEGEYRNTEDYTVINNGKPKKIIISRQPNNCGTESRP